MHPTAAYLVTHFAHGLDHLKSELEAYPNEDALWLTAKGIKNSGGNLAYHLLGNLNHYIGATLGDTGYMRNRPLEFSIKNFPSHKLLAWIDETQVMLNDVIGSISDFSTEYPRGMLPAEGTIEYQMMHLLRHLYYHTGQINYHRRLLFPEEQ